MPESSQFLVAGRWLCESLIVDGPHGALWRAFDERLRRTVAIRIVPAALIGDPQVRRRIDRLLAVTADLQHDNMAYLYDAFEDEVGVVLVSELIEGPLLTEVRDRLAPAAAEAVAAVAIQLADGLAAIHAGGHVHRALSPENVRITWDGTVKILGFSAARLLADSTATPAAGVEVERSYLAPEQLEGAVSDQRTDIYTLGLLLWELATGRHPRDVDPTTPADPAVPHPPIPSVGTARPDLPVRLGETIDLATRRDPAERWPQAGALRESLQELCPRPVQTLRDVIGAAFAEDRPA